MLDRPSAQGHSRTVPGLELEEEEGQQAHRARTLQPPAQLLGEEDDGQLTLAIRCFGVILPLLPVQVIKVYMSCNVGQGREVDDP